MIGRRIIGAAVWLALAVGALKLLGTLGSLGLRMLDRPGSLGLVILSAVLGVCVVSSFLGLRALGDILVSGRGIRSVWGEQARDAIVFLASVSATSVCLAYLAITDILKDYAGYKLTLPNGEPIRSVLASWARCEGEWSIVFAAIFTVVVSQMGLLALLARREPSAGA